MVIRLKSNEEDRQTFERIIVVVRTKEDESTDVLKSCLRLKQFGFKLDANYLPVPIKAKYNDDVIGNTFVVRGMIDKSKFEKLKSDSLVVEVYRDSNIEPFERPCDCNPLVPKGTIADVVVYLGVDKIWNMVKGKGIVVGIVDGGITAIDRPVRQFEEPRIQRVIGGFPFDNWGTKSDWNEHGNMCAIDILAIAPDVSLYDIRITDNGSTISNSIAGFQWAIDNHKKNGIPQILSNSWGIYQESSDPSYARDQNHPFTRKVVEAVQEGIIVFFAAGNCGQICPKDKCGSDTGPGKGIWGANGHPDVITVGAVNINEEMVGYSSMGPAPLDPNKPDFCSITHFSGYFNSDNGTSAPCSVRLV